ncbi:trans-sialidase [Trypanosoma cruzi]|nr:trans-sialidase [Trypanosoma cruzi]
MSRHVFTSVVLLLLLVIMMCCGSGGAHAVESKPGAVQLPQWVDIFVPNKTQVLPKNGTGETGVKEAFAAPSLVRAGGVMVAFAEGFLEYNGHHEKLFGTCYSDIVAGYIKAAETWPSIVAEIAKKEWRADTVLGSRNGDDRLCVFFGPHPLQGTIRCFHLRESVKGSTTMMMRNGRLVTQLFNWLLVWPRSPRTANRVEWSTGKNPNISCNGSPHTLKAT